MLIEKQLVEQILNSIETMKEASNWLYSYADSNEYNSFIIVAKDLINLLTKTKEIFTRFSKLEPYLDYISINFVCNCIYSVKQIMRLERARSRNIYSKIEFELVPLLEELYYEFYYCVYIKGDSQKEQLFNENDGLKMKGNKYIDKYMKDNTYKYDVSICVLAYNKLEYTQMCVESILKYTSPKINYELILINNGSTDGTKEYFESINPTKQLDIQNNGVGFMAFRRIVEGKYILRICNDVIVTHNYLDNMLKCIESDINIHRVVPTTTNVSNLQTIPCNFNSLETMQEFAYSNNLSNPYKWEQRARLCDPIFLMRSSEYCSSNGIGDKLKRFQLLKAFPDDVLSSLLRRQGKKMILAKDTFCYHYGSVTLKETSTDEKFQHAREEFQKHMGFDPWGKGFCYDPKLIKLLPCNETGHVEVLGINCGIGSNPLKIKEMIKENVNNLDVNIYNLTDEKQYVNELKGVSDNVKYIKKMINYEEAIDNKLFKYIIFEGNLSNFINPVNHLLKLKKYLDKDGILIVLDLNYRCSGFIDKLGKISGSIDTMTNDGKWYVFRNIFNKNLIE